MTMTLRNDVIEAVEKAISVTGNPASFSDYAHAKMIISKACGFLADVDEYDGRQYEQAVRLYCEKVGL